MNKDFKIDTVNQRIAAAREYRKLEQKDLAKLVGVSQAAISKLEANEKTKGGRFIVEIAKALDTSIEWLKTSKGIAPWDEEEEKKPGIIPLVKWLEIPNVYNLPEIKPNVGSVGELNITFRKEENLFASKIPKCVDPGHTSNFFRHGEYVLISPHRPKASAQHIVVTEDNWPEPVFAYYWIQGDTHFVKYPWELKLRKITNKMKVCGVVVATINMLLDHD